MHFCSDLAINSVRNWDQEVSQGDQRGASSVSVSFKYFYIPLNLVPKLPAAGRPQRGPDMTATAMGL